MSFKLPFGVKVSHKIFDNILEVKITNMIIPKKVSVVAEYYRAGSLVKSDIQELTLKPMSTETIRFSIPGGVDLVKIHVRGLLAKYYQSEEKIRPKAKPIPPIPSKPPTPPVMPGPAKPPAPSKVPIRIEVIDEENKPVKNVKMEIFRDGKKILSKTFDYSISIMIAPGRYTFELSAPGYEKLTKQIDILYKRTIIFRLKRLKHKMPSPPVTKPPAKKPPEKKPKKEYTITFRVVSWFERKPVPNAKIVWERQGENIVLGYTDEKGELTVKMPEGKHWVRVIAEGYRPKSFMINVNKDKTITLEIEKKMYEVLVGVVDAVTGKYITAKAGYKGIYIELPSGERYYGTQEVCDEAGGHCRRDIRIPEYVGRAKIHVHVPGYKTVEKEIDINKPITVVDIKVYPDVVNGRTKMHITYFDQYWLPIASPKMGYIVVDMKIKNLGPEKSTMWAEASITGATDRYREVLSPGQETHVSLKLYTNCVTDIEGTEGIVKVGHYEDYRPVLDEKRSFVVRVRVTKPIEVLVKDTYRVGEDISIKIRVYNPQCQVATITVTKDGKVVYLDQIPLKDIVVSTKPFKINEPGTYKVLVRAWFEGEKCGEDEAYFKVI